MARKVISAIVVGACIAGSVIPSVAMAQEYERGGYRSDDGYRDGHRYRGRDAYYRHRCGGGDGAVGTIVGAGGGALIGNALGGGVGTILGGVGGALLGRGLDKEHTRDRNGC